jgi:hypothetical protein
LRSAFLPFRRATWQSGAAFPPPLIRAEPLSIRQEACADLVRNDEKLGNNTYVRAFRQINFGFRGLKRRVPRISA